jgi:hypothetical protein
MNLNEIEKQPQIIDRCIAITNNNKKCRAKVNNFKNNCRFFCCESHLPINKEIIENGCFMCMEKIEELSDMIYFKCKHLFHKPCYLEWLRYSTYENPICLICRTDVLINRDNNINFKKKYKNFDIKSFKQIGYITKSLDKYLYIETKINSVKSLNSSSFSEKLLNKKST